MSGLQGGDVVAHRALGHQHDPAGPLAADIVDHRRGRAGEIGFGHHLGRAFGVGEHDDAGMAVAQLADVRGVKRSCTSQWPAQVMISTSVSRGDVLGQVLVRQHDDRGTPRLSTTFTALPEVQQMSLSAFTAAEVLT